SRGGLFMSHANRRRFLGNCAWLAVGAAGDMLLQRSFSLGEPALAQEGATPSPEERLRALRIELPTVSKPVDYVPTVRVDHLLYVSGYEPLRADGTSIVGKLGRDLDANEGARAARRVALVMLSVVRAELGSLDKVARLVKTFGMV